MIESRCAAISQSQAESLQATASVVRSWVFLEQPGPWGADALRQSDLADDVAEALSERARRHRVRVLLLRRPDHPERAPVPERHCFVAHTARGNTWVERRLVTSDGELLDIDFRRLAAGERLGFGDPHQEPLFLVCTNGRHDPCCAQYGRPVARALVGYRPGAVWECSHIGGDRFAGNLVCFPEGLYFGRLDPDNASAVVEAYDDGRIDLTHYRGRAGDAFPVQAAECFLRAETGLFGLNDVSPTARRKVETDVYEVLFDGVDARRFRVTVAVAPLPDSRPLTCAAVHEEHPPSYSLVSVEALPA